MRKRMKENASRQKTLSTCFEGSPTAEMMQKIMGQQRIGSLSEEMMRSLIKKIDEDIEESHKTKKEEK
jgi:hypothetical protein